MALREIRFRRPADLRPRPRSRRHLVPPRREPGRGQKAPSPAQTGAASSLTPGLGRSAHSPTVPRLTRSTRKRHFVRLLSAPVTISLRMPPRRSGPIWPTDTPLGTRGRPIRGLALRDPVSIPRAGSPIFTLAGRGTSGRTIAVSALARSITPGTGSRPPPLSSRTGGSAVNGLPS
jgi:hypothetical protein